MRSWKGTINSRVDRVVNYSSQGRRVKCCFYYAVHTYVDQGHSELRPTVLSIAKTPTSKSLSAQSSLMTVEELSCEALGEKSILCVFFPFYFVLPPLILLPPPPLAIDSCRCSGLSSL